MTNSNSADSTMAGLDLGLTWRAERVEPDTQYEDEPTETVPAGWWVRGFTAAGNPEVEMRIDQIYNRHGQDVTEQFGHMLADKLNEEAAR